MIAAEPDRVWALVSDPHNLPRYWPRTKRVEDVREEEGRPAWTAVLETERGTGVRADYRCTVLEPGRRFRSQQELEGTPFERILRSSELELRLEPAAGGTEVTITTDETLRGLSRLGAPLMSGAARRRLDEALAGIEDALVERRR